MQTRELTNSEVEIVEALNDVWRAFLSLSTPHDDDVHDFKSAIHAAQRVVLVQRRIGRSHLCGRPWT